MKRRCEAAKLTRQQTTCTTPMLRIPIGGGEVAGSADMPRPPSANHAKFRWTTDLVIVA